MKRLLLLLSCWTLTATDPVVEQSLHVRIAMRDGVRLDANVFRPTGPGRWPTLLVRTPYGKGSAINAHYRAFVDHGYSIVVQDVRGRHDSEGTFRPFDQEGPDGEDTLTWIARQPWADGKVGMMGGSYLGVVQWQLAVRNPPQLKAIFTAVAGFDDYIDRFYSRGGALKLGHRLLWMAENLKDYPGTPDFGEIVRHLPLRTSDRAATGHSVDWYQRGLDHPAYDAFWKSISTREKLEHMRVPVFAVGGWFDNYAQSDLEAFAELRRMGRQSYVMIGPWPHNMADRFTSVEFGAESIVSMRKWQFEWFDHWLKGKDTIGSYSAARYFRMGDNKWLDAPAWPPPGTRITPLYLSSKGHANSVDGDGTLDSRRRRTDKSDEFSYDPRNPVPTRGGATCCNFKVFPAGPMDQRSVEKRGDVLVYTGEVLKKEMEVTGPIRVQLYASTSTPDTDFTAKLVDVYPDGTALSVTDGILRLRYRNSLERPEGAKPGEIYSLTVDAGDTSILFAKGHRIRVEISSSNFPRFDRNPNTGRSIADETELRTARQTVHHGTLTPSALLLPVATRIRR